jgi:hypothetical protein
MRIVPVVATVALALGLALVAGPVAAAQVYKWKDANGVVHYADTPPPKGTESSQVAVKPDPIPPADATATPATATAPATAGAAGAPSPEAQAQVAVLRKQACENARARAQQLASLPSVAMDLNKDGTPEQLNAEQHAAELTRANQAVANYCDPQ